MNLGGNCKFPFTPNDATHLPASPEFFTDHRNVSFVGRPFPLAEADEHFTRLRAWGFLCLRFCVTWEAIEHAGPKQYDQDYLDYIFAVVAKANEYGLRVVIDPHQDVWSRFTGGDGAPGWVFEKVGFDLANFHATGAATLHQLSEDPAKFPLMLWPTNYLKLACATMFTLFWAGNEFAPLLQIEGRSAQDYLQEHYIGALAELAKKLAPLPNVVGFGPMNEPSKGYFNTNNLAVLVTDLKKGVLPSPFEGMVLGEGFTREIGVYAPGIQGNLMNSPISRVTVNPNRLRAWLPGRECIWKQHGVWGLTAQGAPVLLKPQYFKTDLDFGRSCYLPFAQRYAAAVREHCPGCLIFVELPPADFGAVPFPAISAEELPGAVNASHWYDGMTLFRGTYSAQINVDVKTKWPVLGKSNVRALLARQLAEIKHTTADKMPGAPTLIGEVGIPYNMNDREAYRTGDFSSQVQALNASIVAMESNLLNFTLWHYSATNSNEWGDCWNREDLSLFSRDQQKEDWKQNINSGGRAVTAFCRPYPISVCGTVTFSAFNLVSRIYVLDFEEDAGVSQWASSEVYVPAGVHYPQGYRVLFTGGSYSFVDGGDKTSHILVLHCSQHEASQFSASHGNNHSQSSGGSMSEVGRNSLSVAPEEGDNSRPFFAELDPEGVSSPSGPSSPAGAAGNITFTEDHFAAPLRLPPTDFSVCKRNSAPFPSLDDSDDSAKPPPPQRSVGEETGLSEAKEAKLESKEGESKVEIHSADSSGSREPSLKEKALEVKAVTSPRSNLSVPTRAESRRVSGSKPRPFRHRLVLWPKEVPIQQPLPQTNPILRNMMLQAMMAR